MKSTPKIGISSGSREMNDSQATPATSVTNEDEKSFQETVKKFLSKKNMMKENHSFISLETLSKRNLKFTRVTSKN